MLPWEQMQDMACLWILYVFFEFTYPGSIKYIILNNFKEVDVSISDEVIDCDIQMEDILWLKEVVNLINKN